MNTPLSRRWAVIAAASGTVLIGAGAFWLSFVALADLAVRSGIEVGQAWIWPLLVDGLIVVATVAVVALDGHRSAWYPWALLIAGALMSVTANAAHALVAATASVPGLLASTVAAVPPLVLLASTHLTVVLTRSTKTPEPPASPVDAQAGEPSSALTEAVNAGHKKESGHGRALELPERPEPTADAEPATRQAKPPVSALIPAPSPAPRGEPASKASAEPGPAASEPPEPTSAVAGPDRRERAEALREAGWSNKAIARELGVHASTVGRWAHRTTSPEPDALAEPETPADAEMKEDKEKENPS